MLDAGVYSLWFSQFILGAPTTVTASGLLAPTGVDAQAVATLDFDGGAQSSITTTILVSTLGGASIHGTDASIRYDADFVFPAPFVFTGKNGDETWRDESGLTGRDGLAWQAVALAQFVSDGRTESPIHSLDNSISLMRTIDEVRSQLGAR
jgi:predicted dehydrogenase